MSANNKASFEIDKTIIAAFIAVVILGGLLIFLLSPEVVKGPLKSKTYTYTTFIEKLSSARTTESFSVANTGEILSQYSGVRPDTSIDADGNITTRLESYTVYTYRPWELYTYRSKVGEEEPSFPNTDDFTEGPELRKIYKREYFWNFENKQVIIPSIEEWRKFNTGDVLAVKYRFGRLVSAELVKSELDDQENFDF